MKEACGVFGVYAPGAPVAHLLFDGLFALQHRGQESAGMAVSDGDSMFVVKDMGLVASVFEERTLSSLQGHIGLGHVRYSTTGPSTWHNAQPVHRSVGAAGFALGHNGNLTNTDELAQQEGMLPGITTSDSDLVAELLAMQYPIEKPPGDDLDDLDERSGPAAPAYGHSTEQPPPAGDDRQLERALMAVLPRLEGAFSFGVMDETHLIGVRDPHGFRPLCLGRLDLEGPSGPATGWVIASESPALAVVGATFVREIQPGEMVVVDAEGPRSCWPFPPEAIEPRLCVFEFVYFARPDSVLHGREVYATRRRMGELLAEEYPVEADLVMGVPDSGASAAEGYSARSGIPFGQGLVKNRYIGRTFIAPTQEARARGVRRKLNPLSSTIAGKRLVVIDDSIVRGTTTRQLVKMLREAGASEVHLRISSPPFRWPCYYGIDTPDRDELIAAQLSVEEITAHLGADSLSYLSIEHLMQAVGTPGPGEGYCNACLTGHYATEVPVQVATGDQRSAAAVREADLALASPH